MYIYLLWITVCYEEPCSLTSMYTWFSYLTMLKYSNWTISKSPGCSQGLYSQGLTVIHLLPHIGHILELSWEGLTSYRTNEGLISMADSHAPWKGSESCSMVPPYSAYQHWNITQQVNNNMWIKWSTRSKYTYLRYVCTFNHY